jgi:hypothetical protein
MPHTVPKLNDPSLLKLDVAYVNGEWVKAASGKTFEVHGMYSELRNQGIEQLLTSLLFVQIPRQASLWERRPSSMSRILKKLSMLQPQPSPHSGPRPDANAPSYCENGTI